MHLLSALILIADGAIQFVPQIRDAAPRFHRWNGRIYVLTAFTTSVAGLYMTWVRGTFANTFQRAGITLNAILIVVCALFAWRSALARRFSVHRDWTLRLFLVANGAWFFRVGTFLWFLHNRALAGVGPEAFQAPAVTVMTFAQSLLPLAILELYLRAKNPPQRMAMAATLFAITIAMGIGIFAVTVGMWLPLIRLA